MQGLIPVYVSVFLFASAVKMYGFLLLLFVLHHPNKQKDDDKHYKVIHRILEDTYI